MLVSLYIYSNELMRSDHKSEYFSSPKIKIYSDVERRKNKTKIKTKKQTNQFEKRTNENTFTLDYLSTIYTKCITEVGQYIYDIFPLCILLYFCSRETLSMGSILSIPCP